MTNCCCATVADTVQLMTKEHLLRMHSSTHLHLLFSVIFAASFIFIVFIVIASNVKELVC